MPIPTRTDRPSLAFHHEVWIVNKVVVSSVIALALTGCATSPDKLQAAYVSPLEFGNHDCNQLAGEFQRVSRRTNELYTSLKKKSDDDNAQMAVGMLLFWPALFFLEGGDSAEATEYSRLRGEHSALETVAIRKSCDATIVTEMKPGQPLGRTSRATSSRSSAGG